MNWSLITASNNEAVLQSCLASSACAAHARDFRVMRGFASAGVAYNAGMRQAVGDILVFAHQDVYLPEGWDDCLTQTITRLCDQDPDWALLGVWGLTAEATPAGHSYCTGLQKVLGLPFEKPVPCTSLDEALLVLRRSSGLAFDEQLPGYHLYGTDICLTATQNGMNCYVIPDFCIHNTAGLKFLPWAFWRAYFFMRRKWWRHLPITTPCTRIERVPVPFIRQSLMNFYLHRVRRDAVGSRVSDPRALYGELVRTGKVPLPELPTAPSISSRP